jgi:hypothetical protein
MKSVAYKAAGERLTMASEPQETIEDLRDFCAGSNRRAAICMQGAGSIWKTLETE